MIRTLTDLIERLEGIKADIPVTGLTVTEYGEVGWARRPLDTLLERCREHLDDLNWQAQDQGERARLSNALEAAQ